MPLKQPVTFDIAVTAIQTDAGKTFSTAYEVFHTALPLEAASNATEQQKRDAHDNVVAAQQRKAAAQAEMVGALGQLIQTETFLSEQQGRTGYKAVTDLMTSTATAAAAVCTKLQGLITQTETPGLTDAEIDLIYARITALSEALQGLGAVSPSAVWQK